MTAGYKEISHKDNQWSVECILLPHRIDRKWKLYETAIVKGSINSNTIKQSLHKV